MYLSHPVRRMREDPVEGESVTLVVTAESDNAVPETAIEESGGTVEKPLQFGALLVEIDQAQIDDLCAIDGIESIETANTVGVGGDAGEDIGSE